jgi:hypothetical protein
MRALAFSWARMTALVGREVERTFSGVARYLTGLASTETHEASRQNLGNLIEPLGGGHMAGVEGVHQNQTRYGFVGDQFSDEFYRWSRRGGPIGAVR